MTNIAVQKSSVLFLIAITIANPESNKGKIYLDSYSVVRAVIRLRWIRMFTWLKKRRKYANFFEAPTKELKELSVSEEWLSTYGVEHGYDEKSLVACNNQWPDCEVKMYSGGLCGIEVTELVDQECIERNENNQDVYRLWNDDEIIEAIERRLKDKNTKSHGGKYQKLIVLIHTDEIEITSDRGNEAIGAHTFSGFKNIDDAYLVYSYEPSNQGYPITSIKLSD